MLGLDSGARDRLLFDNPLKRQLPVDGGSCRSRDLLWPALIDRFGGI